MQEIKRYRPGYWCASASTAGCTRPFAVTWPANDSSTRCACCGYLETRGCEFVPGVLEAEPGDPPEAVTTNCGSRVDQLGEERQKEIFAELERYGVRHDDRELRNITYRIADGRFCVIDFELRPSLLDGPPPPKPSSDGS
jgi:hypothetical protein